MVEEFTYIYALTFLRYT